MADSADDKQYGLGGSFVIDWHGDIAVLTIDCGQNKCNNYLVDNFNKSLDQVLANPAAKGLITQGKGKHYNNGLDLDWLMMVSADIIQSFDVSLRRLFERIATFPLPTVAALNGHTYAAGAILSLCHDYRVMNSDRGWWCLNEVHIGMRFSPFTMACAKTKLPSGPVFHEALVMGRRFTAPEAVACSIVHESVPRDEVLPRALHILREITPSQNYNRQCLQANKTDAFRNVLDVENRIRVSVKSEL